VLALALCPWQVAHLAVGRSICQPLDPTTT
jgi:hypothetical protein